MFMNELRVKMISRFRSVRGQRVGSSGFKAQQSRPSPSFCSRRGGSAVFALPHDASILFAVWRPARWKALAAGHQHSWQRGRGQRLRLGMVAYYVYVNRESKRSMPERDCECLLMALVCFSS